MLLAIDTSTRVVGLALYDGIQVLGEYSWVSEDYHTVELAPAVVDLLNRSGRKIADVQALGVAIGPGSFTGLRIGLALAKGLALARRLPMVGIPTLDILAASQPILNIPMAAVLQAGRGRLAVGWYRHGRQRWEANVALQILDIQHLVAGIEQPTLVCGELSEGERRILNRNKAVQLASPARSLRRPAFLAEMAWKRWQSGRVDDPATLAPIYLHIGEPVPG